MDLVNKDGQPAVDPSSESGQPTGSMLDMSAEVEVKIGDEIQKVTIEELQKWYMRQADYTKKTTALSEDKKKILDPELEQAQKVLQELWFAKTDDLKGLIEFKEQYLTEKQIQSANQEFEDFAKWYSSLSDAHKSILKDLKKVHSDKSYDEILESSGLLDQSLIEKSKQARKIWSETIWLSVEEKKASINPEVLKKRNIKPASDILEIKSKFNL